MGLSLRNIGKDIGGFLSGAAHVAQGVERQINPFDNGATYSNPNPAPRPVAPAAAPIQSAGFNPNFQGPQMGPPPQFGLQDSSNPFSNPLVTAKPKQQNVTQSQSNAPAAGDVPGLKKALQGIGSYNSDDQARIVNRASQAGLIPGNVAAAMQNQILSPTLSTDRSRLGELAQAASTSLLPGASNLAKQVGTNLASQNLLNQSLNGQYNPGIVNNTLNQANAENGGIVDNLKGISAPHLAGQTIQGAVALGTLGLGGEAAQGISKVPTLLNTAKASAKLGVGLGVPGGVAQTLSGDNYSPGEFAKNIATNTAQMAALPAVAGGLPIVTARLAETAGKPAIRAAQTAVDNRVPLNAIGAVGKDVNKYVTPKDVIPGSYEDTKLSEAFDAAKRANAPPKVSLKTTSPISGREVDPQALVDLPQGEQLKTYGQDNPNGTFNGPPLKLKSQQPETKLSLSAQTPKAAIGENTYIMGEHSKKFNEAINVGDKLSEGDKAKLSDALNGRDVEQVDNPQLFNKTVDNLKGAYDNSLAVNRLAGGKTARFNKGNFSPLYLKADTARLDELGVPKDQQYDLGNGQSMYVQAGEDSPLTSGKFKGYRNIQRKYADYQDAAQQSNGILQPLNANALEDARMYANQAHSSLEGNLLFKQLKKIAPDQVSEDLNQKFGKSGEPLVHAANGQLPFNVSKSLNRQLTGFKSNRITSPIGEAAFKAVEVPSKGLRKVAFLGAPIHYANLTRSFLATTLPSGHAVTGVRGIGEALGSSFHPKVYAALEKTASTVKPGQEFSPREFAGKLGIVDRDTRPNLLAKGTGVKGTVEKYSPFALQMRNLNRFNNVLGWKLAERVQELGVEPGTAQATAIGTEINKVIDRINPKMEGLNPIGERLATSGSLAPHWIRANLGLVKDALKESVPGIGTAKTGFGLSNAGDIARTNVVGGRVLLGGTAILASAIATGKMPTLTQALNEAGLNPNNPIPNVEGKSQTKAKYPGGPRYGQVTNLPTDPIGLAVGLLTDPKHFAIARETPALSAATQAITNQDFFGNPIVDKSQPGWQKKLAVATAEKLIPFTGQNIQNKALTPGQKLEASVGLRTKTDPNDPNYQQVQNYFKGVADAKKGLDPQAVRAVDEYTASKKDSFGNYIAPNANDTVAKARLLLQNPSAIDSLIKMNQNAAKQGGKVDPLWGASKDQITKVLQYQSMPPGGADRTHWEAQNGSWYQPLSDQRTAFFNSLPKGDPNKPQAPVQYPDASPDVAALQKQFFDITDTKERAQFLQDHPEVQTQLDAQIDYNNKMREAQGYSALDKFPTASPDVQKIINEYNALPQHDGPKGGSKTRSLWITAHPDAYKAMSDYYTQSSLYGLEKEAGQAQFADTGASQKLLKDAYSLGKYDIVKNADGTYSLGSSSSDSSGGSSGKGYTKYARSGAGGGAYVSRTAAELANPYFDAIDIDAGGKKNIGKAQKPKVSKTVSFKPKVTGFKPKAATANLPAAVAPTKLKANLKKSKV